MFYGFGLARSLRITWLEPNQPNLRRVEDVNRVEKKHCLVCNSSSTTTIFRTETSQGSFEFQKAPLNCDSEKVLYSLKCKVSGDVH